ncbi:MAG: ribosome-binding factor A [Verrucomicrobiales bacterium]|jgi:ribosome-binding factor A
MLRVRELMKRELGVILNREFEFGGALVSVADVDVTPDLRQGHVFVSTLGAKGREQSIIDKLNANSGVIQNKMIKRVVLKFTPQLHFKHDDSIKRGVEMVEFIDDIDIPDEIAPLGENDVEI